MDSPSGWKVITSDAVTLDVVAEEVEGGRCLRLEYHFRTGAGYAIIQKPILIDVPENYEFAFRVRGEGPANNLEFKLLDDSGDNVWWQIRRAYEWPPSWTRLVSKARHIEFAWGPLAGAPLRQVAKLEFAISSNSGGRGTVWLDDLTFRELPRARQWPPELRPVNDAGKLAVDGDVNTAAAVAAGSSIAVDLGEPAEFGAVEVQWGAKARAFSVHGSDDGTSWSELAGPRSPGIARTVVPTPGAQARYIQVRVERDAEPASIAELRLRPAEYSTSPNTVVAEAARESRRGMLPRQFLGEQSYWTVIGTENSQHEALINEEGTVEVGKRMFSLDPAVVEEGRLLTWAEGTHRQALAGGSLPLPNVTRTHQHYELTIEPLMVGDTGSTRLYVRYTLRNTTDRPMRPTLAIAARPFQVNPPWQRLNFEGGVSPIREVRALSHGRLRVNTGYLIVPLDAGARSLASPWSAGEVFEWLDAGREPGIKQAECPDGLASGAVLYELPLGPHESKAVSVGLRLTGEEALIASGPGSAAALESEFARAKEQWSERLSRAAITVPERDAWLADTFKAQLAYILVNRDGPAIQPGSRSYERSWARDGSLTSAALLTLGHAEEVRAWIDWFGQHLFENGKVPCVVDTRGPDPVPEHDSHGQYIWAVSRYYRFTGDRAFLEAHWPRVQKVVDYIRSLRAERMTAAYEVETFPQGACFGLVPESISHEGYSAKPMHSYWDDFFVLLGLREAAWMAEEVEGAGGETTRRFQDEAVDFAACLGRSIERTQAHHKIDYIPGCVELGDFDATSTTIALFPCAAEGVAGPGLRPTFDRYWAFALERMSGSAKWDGYTPYEWRTVGAFIRMGQRDRAYALMQWFQGHQRPEGWRHWAEVVFNDPLSPRFIGDMPHTWCGSDFLNSVTSMFVYEEDESLTLFAGVPREWIDSGEAAGFQNLVTPYGTFSGSMRRVGQEVRVRVSGERRPHRRGSIKPWPEIKVAAPPGAIESSLTVEMLPAEIVFHLR